MALGLLFLLMVIGLFGNCAAALYLTIVLNQRR